jgi:hypothetical protein
VLRQHPRDRGFTRPDAPGKADRKHRSDRSIGPIGHDLFSRQPEERLAAAQKVSRRARKNLEKRAKNWPENSPAAINAWLLLVTTKPPTWRDPLVLWREEPPSLGRANEGFWYPDPLGFFAEVRHWSVEIFDVYQPGWGPHEALSLTALLHSGGDRSRLTNALELCRPQVILFLDEHSWELSGLEVRQVAHHITDPHRPKQVYEGFWGHTEDGRVVGKSPQHPTTHNLYRAKDMSNFLRSAPAPEA